ncbi:MAG: late competence development ComFB family protein [Firmicutes bacterium]|nr:late competence development ComFB family protein [Bacillota bacterium]
MYKIKNYMENVVESATENILKLMNICKCEKCKADIMAIALNELPPKYIVTEIGELYTKANELEQQFSVDVQTAIIKAALIVGKNPKHD